MDFQKNSVTGLSGGSHSAAGSLCSLGCLPRAGDAWGLLFELKENIFCRSSGRCHCHCWASISPGQNESGSCRGRGSPGPMGGPDCPALGILVLCRRCATFCDGKNDKHQLILIKKRYICTKGKLSCVILSELLPFMASYIPTNYCLYY